MITGINPIKSGGCAHGLPAGACPICSGGGGGSVKKKEEMSWDECYTIGQAMKAAKQRAVDNKILDQIVQSRTTQLQRQANIVQNQTQPIVNLVKMLPVPVQNVISNVKQAILENLNRFTLVITNQLILIKEKLQFILNNYTNIMDKLAAIFGELENKIKEFIAKNLKQIRKKLFVFFEMIDGSLEQGDHEKDEENRDEYNGESEND